MSDGVDGFGIVVFWLVVYFVIVEVVIWLLLCLLAVVVQLMVCEVDYMGSMPVSLQGMVLPLVWGPGVVMMIGNPGLCSCSCCYCSCCRMVSYCY